MSNHRPSGKSSSLDRVSRTACIRCRQKKKRCDQQLPKCRLCSLAGVECLGYDAVAKRQVPRSYIQGLEERVAQLEAQLQRYQNRDEHLTEGTQGISPSSSAHMSDAAFPNVPSIESPLLLEHESDSIHAARSTAAEVSRLAQQASGQELPFFKIALDEIIKSGMSPTTRLHRENAHEKENAFGIMGDLDANPISLPSKETAQNLVKTYFQHTNMTMPLLHEPTFQQKLELLYQMPRAVNLTTTHKASDVRLAVFFVLEVFAVTLLLLQKQDPSRIPTWLADRYHQTSAMALSEIGVPNDVEGVQALLLVGQFSHYHPTAWSAWRIVSQAFRLGVELRLHEDPSDDLDFLQRDTMRRVFWVAYSMDRNLSSTMCLPCCLPDGAISTKFPSDVDDKYITSDQHIEPDGPVSTHKRINLHYCRYRQIQSEMQTVLFQAPEPPYQQIDLERWQQDMKERIETWYMNSPLGEDLSSAERGVVETFKVNYHNAIFYLYRPSPNIPAPSDAQLVLMTQAAADMIRLYRHFFREHKLNIYWQAVENLYSAGSALMYAYGHSPRVRDLLTFRSLESLVHTCSSALWGMVERFPAFKGKRDAFDLAASTILASLATSFDVNQGPSTLSWLAQQGGSGESGILSGAGDLQTSRLSSFQPHRPGPNETRVDSGLHSPSLNGRLDGSAPMNDLSFIDFDDLSMVWEVAVGGEGSLNPAWI